MSAGTMNRKTILVGVAGFVLTVVLGVAAGAVFGDDDESATPSPGPEATTTSVVPPPMVDLEDVVIVDPVYVGPPVDASVIAGMTGSADPGPDGLEPPPDGVEEPPPSGLPFAPVVVGQGTRQVPPAPDGLPDPVDTCGDDDCRAAVGERRDELDRVAPGVDDELLEALLERIGGQSDGEIVVDEDDDTGGDPCALAEDPDQCRADLADRLEQMTDRLAEIPELSTDERSAFVDPCVDTGATDGDPADETPSDIPSFDGPPEDEEPLASIDPCQGEPATVTLDDGSSVDVIGPFVFDDHHVLCGDSPDLEDGQRSLLFGTSLPASVRGTAQAIDPTGAPVGDPVPFRGLAPEGDPVTIPPSLLGAAGARPVSYYPTCAALDRLDDFAASIDVQALVIADGATPRSVQDEIPLPIATLEGEGGTDAPLLRLSASDLVDLLDALDSPERGVFVSEIDQERIGIQVDVRSNERASAKLIPRDPAMPEVSRCDEAPQAWERAHGPRVGRSWMQQPFTGYFDLTVQRYETPYGTSADLCIDVETDATPPTAVAHYEYPVVVPDPTVYEISAGPIFPGVDAVVPDEMSMWIAGPGGQNLGCSGAAIGVPPVGGDREAFVDICTVRQPLASFDLGVRGEYDGELGAPLTSRQVFDEDRCPSPTEPCDALLMAFYAGPDGSAPTGTRLFRVRRASAGTASWDIGPQSAADVSAADAGPALVISRSSVEPNPDDPARSIVVDVRADRPVSGTVHLRQRITSTTSTGGSGLPPCRGGMLNPAPLTPDEADPTHLALAVRDLCPATQYDAYIVLTDEDGQSNAFSDRVASRPSWPVYPIGGIGDARTEPFEVPVHIEFEVVDRYTGFFGLPWEKVGLIPRHFSASVANEDLFPAYQQPVGATAHYGLDCADGAFFSRESDTTLRIGQSFGATAGIDLETWRPRWRGNLCPTPLQQGAGWAIDSLEHRGSARWTIGYTELVDGLAEGGIELLLDDGTDPSRRVSGRDDHRVIAVLRIEPQPGADPTVAVAAGG
ncbi:hypothetical protein [Actinospongicola halichondriae]|uniref:hypothetical protein n=1 Tax=Actinospongicola halichondriae TaxID=3236844 RepID=UPI003D56D755